MTKTCEHKKMMKTDFPLNPAQNVIVWICEDCLHPQSHEIKNKKHIKKGEGICINCE